MLYNLKLSFFPLHGIEIQHGLFIFSLNPLTFMAFFDTLKNYAMCFAFLYALIFQSMFITKRLKTRKQENIVFQGSTHRD